MIEQISELRRGTIPNEQTTQAPSSDEGLLSQQDPIFMIGVIALILVVLAWGLVAILGSTRNAQIAEADKKIQQIDTEMSSNDVLVTALKDYNGVNTVAQHIGKILASRYLFLPTWNTLKENIPSDLQFKTVSMAPDQSFFITGTSRSVGSVANFAAALRNKPEFTEITPLSIDKADSESQPGEAYNFSLNFRVSSKTNERAE